MSHRNSRIASLVLASTLTLSSFAVGGELADTHYGEVALDWQAKTQTAALTISISGADGFYYQESFDGTNASFSLFDASGEPLPDGTYPYELRPTAALSQSEQQDRAAERQQDPGALAKAYFFDESATTESGSFAVQQGRIVNPEATEAAPAGKAVSDAGAKAQTFATDLIVQGSSCIGFDCTTSESFGFDTLRLKENNLRIKFDDTSGSASFPGNDWELTANDSSNGGQNRFSITDVTGNKTPFTTLAGAPNHSLYIAADGKIGVGTSSPAINMHIVEGNTPTVRLDQDGSSGFTPQVWDLAGNETNFFLRDVTNGSKLPFRIKPGAPTDSLFVAANGNVGFGTDDPSADIHVKNATGENVELLFGDGTQDWKLRAKGADGQFNLINETASTTPLRVAKEAVTGLLEVGVDAVDQVTVAGNITATTFTATAVGSQIPDYVFEEDYNLMPLDELAAYIAKEKHLPRIPSADEIGAAGRFDMTALQLSLLEKVEELTLYTLAQHETIAALEARLAELEGGEGAN